MAEDTNGAAEPAPPDYDSMTNEQLAEAFAAEAAKESEVEPEAEPEPVVEEEVATEKPAATASETAGAEDAATEEEAPAGPTLEERVAAIEAAHTAERESLLAKLELQKAHNARLSGKIGELNTKLKTRPADSPEESEDAEAEAELDERPVRGRKAPAYIRHLQDRLDRLIERTESREIAQALVDGAGEGRGEVDTTALAQEIQEVGSKYRQDWEAANSAPDARTAKMLAASIVRSILAEAKLLKATKLAKEGATKRAVSAAAVAAEKLAATAASPGKAARRDLKPKTYAEMTNKELDDAFKRQYGPRA